MSGDISLFSVLKSFQAAEIAKRFNVDEPSSVRNPGAGVPATLFTGDPAAPRATVAGTGPVGPGSMMTGPTPPTGVPVTPPSGLAPAPADALESVPGARLSESVRVALAESLAALTPPRGANRQFAASMSLAGQLGGPSSGTAGTLTSMAKPVSSTIVPPSITQAPLAGPGPVAGIASNTVAPVGESGAPTTGADRSRAVPFSPALPGARAVQGAGMSGGAEPGQSEVRGIVADRPGVVLSSQSPAQGGLPRDGFATVPVGVAASEAARVSPLVQPVSVPMIAPQTHQDGESIAHRTMSTMPGSVSPGPRSADGMSAGSVAARLGADATPSQPQRPLPETRTGAQVARPVGEIAPRADSRDDGTSRIDHRGAAEPIVEAASIRARGDTSLAPSAPATLRAAMQVMMGVEAAGVSQAAFSFETRVAAAGVILNAAIMPGWPYPSAMVRDSPRFEPAALKAMGEQMAEMTPEEMAEYLAKIGADHRFLRALRRVLKRLDGIEADVAMGFFAMLGAALTQVTQTLKLALALVQDEAALRELVGAEDGAPPPGGPPRRRLRI